MEIKQQKRDVFRDARGLRKTKNQFNLALHLHLFCPLVGSFETTTCSNSQITDDVIMRPKLLI